MGWVLSEEAETDLQDIFLYSEESWGTPQAEKYLHALFRSFETLAANPQIGRQRPDIREGLRSLVHAPHVIFFTAMENDIGIIRILHGSRDIEALFRKPDTT